MGLVRVKYEKVNCGGAQGRCGDSEQPNTTLTWINIYRESVLASGG
jgi:hypothetical protein